jgi:hypothetical protein
MSTGSINRGMHSRSKEVIVSLLFDWENFGRRIYMGL